jgi:hypothetical protein
MKSEKKQNKMREGGGVDSLTKRVDWWTVSDYGLIHLVLIPVRSSMHDMIPWLLTF